MLSNRAVPREYGKFRRAVLAGKIPVNKQVSLEMNRIDALIEDPQYYYDDRAIEGFVSFCENELTQTNGDAVRLLPSFKLWAECLLAWFYYADEKVYNEKKHRYETRKVLRRLVNIQYLIVGRGAAKTMYASFLHAYFLYVDTSTTKQVATAPTVRQAEETLDPIKTAIVRHRGPLLTFLTKGNKLSNNEVTKVKTASTKKGIQNFLTNSLLEIVPMKIDKLQGSRAKINTVDEWLSGDIKEDPIEAMAQSAQKGECVDGWVVLAISSEGTIRNGVGDTIKMQLERILRGEIVDPHVSIWYYRLDSVAEVGKPEMWLKANPNIGATVPYEAYIRAVHTAETDPSKRNDILAKRFGIPIEGFTYFFTYEETLLHPPKSFDGFECSMGADLSQGDDFCAFTFLFPLDGERFGVKTRAYVAENKYLKLREATRMKYDEFIKEGSLVVMPGGILRLPDVYDDLDEYIDKHRYIVLTFGFDPYQAEYFVDRWIKENGSFGVEKVIQGAKTESVPMGELKHLAEDRSLIFDQELMKFTMGNAIAIEDNNGNRKLSKKRADEKIDSVSALIDAWVAFRRNQEVY